MCRGVNVPCICQSFYTQQLISSARYVFTTTTPTAPRFYVHRMVRSPLWSKSSSSLKY